MIRLRQVKGGDIRPDAEDCQRAQADAIEGQGLSVHGVVVRHGGAGQGGGGRGGYGTAQGAGRNAAQQEGNEPAKQEQTWRHFCVLV